MIRANQVPAGHGWEWVKSGFALFRKAPLLWLTMAFVYLVLALVLEQIPFIGWLIMALLTPMLMFGALPVAAALAGQGLPADAVPATPAERNIFAATTWRVWRDYVRDVLAGATRRLFVGFSDEDKLMPVMVISTLLLGGLVVIRILAQLLKVGGAALPAMLSGSVGPSVWLTALLGLAIVLTLETLLIMAFLYTVPLILFRREYPLPAIESSFSATLNNLGALAVFGAVFTLAVELARGLFYLLNFPFDYLAFLAIGLVALPVFVTGLYASYRDLYTQNA